MHVLNGGRRFHPMGAVKVDTNFEEGELFDTGLDKVPIHEMGMGEHGPSHAQDVAQWLLAGRGSRDKDGCIVVVVESLSLWGFLSLPFPLAPLLGVFVHDGSGQAEIGKGKFQNVERGFVPGQIGQEPTQC